MDPDQRPTGLLLDLQERAAGVDPAALRLSWIVPPLGDARQRSYRLQISEDPACAQILWDSGTVDSPDSTGVLVEDLPLAPSTPYWWRVWLATSETGDWSEPALFTTAPDRWLARPIWAAGDPDWALLRREITLPDTPICAAFLESVGLSPEGGPAGAAGPRGGRQHVAKMWVNGQVTGFSSARSADGRPSLHTHHVADLLRPGANALAVLAWAQEGRQVAVRLVVVLADGTRLEHTTGPDTWRALPGDRLLPGTRSIGGFWYHAPAEDWDLREEPAGWTLPGFDDGGWAPAATAPPLPGRPVPATVSLHQESGVALRPEPVGPAAGAPDPPEPGPVGSATVGPDAAPAATWRIDLGREIVGGLRLRCRASDGARIAVHLGEQRDEHGRVLSAMPTGNVYEETWTLRAGEQEVEHWGYRAFRYADLHLLSGTVSDLEVTPTLLTSGTAHTGSFASSDPDLDRVHELCRYSIEATTLDLYLDTPARERLPYEGDAYVNQLSQYACERSFALARASTRYLTRRPTWPAEYHLMPVLLAWEDYLATGDDAQLRTDLDLWRAAGYDRALGADGLVHLEPGSSSGWDAVLVDWPVTCRDDVEITEVSTVLNAFQAAAHDALGRICTALGRPREAAHHAERAAGMRAATERLLVRADGVLRDGLRADGSAVEHAAQHSSAIPVALGQAPAAHRDALAEHLAAGGMRMSIYGAQFLLDALFSLGRADEALALLTSRGERGWLHGIADLGATIVPEAWDPSLKPNMTYSHAWGTAPVNVLARWVLGVRIVAPGAARLEIAPRPGPLRWMEGTVPTIRGDVRVRYDAAGRELEVDVPANVSAVVRWKGVEREVGPGVTVLHLP
ncbi:family 78 glycoside hydrolase catalytic domain [Brachybacterium sp. J153]|uniref:family 78 glycoside hydrolase catalytic domain n=1 Tax=Brachybacterium sp. J153 TaxID=3116488 RepID=UPI002E796C3F|nr:family 78 glycoside hydrolase catalytic domain [Brachybacterium sp. J153]MEE1618507.1 family 78 glycoside hydrolase catalytic domain [Brachybacterium sp. J153]